MPRNLIRAAGGLLWRDSARGRELAVIHRCRYDDWTLPKGKLKPGEDWAVGALREVREETGCQARLKRFAGAVRYTVDGLPKEVRFWHMALRGKSKFRASEEVDELRWMTPSEALAILTYEHERSLLEGEMEDA